MGARSSDLNSTVGSRAVDGMAMACGKASSCMGMEEHDSVNAFQPCSMTRASPRENPQPNLDTRTSQQEKTLDGLCAYTYKLEVLVFSISHHLPSLSAQFKTRIRQTMLVSRLWLSKYVYHQDTCADCPKPKPTWIESMFYVCPSCSTLNFAKDHFLSFIMAGPAFPCSKPMTT